MAQAMINFRMDEELKKSMEETCKDLGLSMSTAFTIFGIKYLMDNYVYQYEKQKKDKELIETLQNITDIFLSLLAIIDSIKFHSSDYLDALEMDMEPLEGSQYWVCPVIVEYMNDKFDKGLLRYIQENEGHGMQFLAEYYNR